MKNTTKELATQALNELLTTMKYYAKERPHDSEVICALSKAIAAVSYIAPKQPISEAMKCNGDKCEEKSIRGAKL